MQIYPALDLLDGQCVRLRQGVFEEKTIYSENPEAVIQKMRSSGARFLHLVDLSGAKDPEKRQVSLIRDLVQKSGLQVQTGGGIRSYEEVRDLLATGVDRVVIGSLAFQNPQGVVGILREFSSRRITLAMDLHVSASGDLKAATQGWKDSVQEDVFETLSFFQAAGITRILCTDISRDGMLKGPNLGLYQKLMAQFPDLEVQASGGVSSLQDLIALKKLGIHSIIVGKALYEGCFSLEEALALC